MSFLTNASGHVTDSYDYDAFGNTTSRTGETENNYLYCGEQFDSTTGLYYLRARYMNPSTGTFISMDAYQGSVYDPVSLHKYLYANANPVMYSDPSGYSTLGNMSTATAIHMVLLGSIASGTISLGLSIINDLRNQTDVGTMFSNALKAFVTGAFVGELLICLAIISPVGLLLSGLLSLALSMFGTVVSANTAVQCFTEGDIFYGVLYSIAVIGSIFGINISINTIASALTSMGFNPYASLNPTEAKPQSVESFIENSVPAEHQSDVQSAFGSDARVVTLSEDTVVYRYYGGGSNARSYWVTPNQTQNPVSDLSLPPSNPATSVEVYIIPKGTTVLSGSVPPKFNQPGGGQQFYVPDPSILM